MYEACVPFVLVDCWLSPRGLSLWSQPRPVILPQVEEARTPDPGQAYLEQTINATKHNVARIANRWSKAKAHSTVIFLAIFGLLFVIMSLVRAVLCCAPGALLFPPPHWHCVLVPRHTLPHAVGVGCNCSEVSSFRFETERSP